MALSTQSTSPEVIMTYEDSKGGQVRKFSFYLNVSREADRDKLIRTVTWAALSGVTIKLTPVSKAVAA